MNTTLIKSLKIFFLSIILFLIINTVYFFVYNIAEPKMYDFMTKLSLIHKLPFDNHKKIYGNDDVVLVVIDAKSVEKHRWPWKRELYGDILDYFHNYAAEKIIIDDSILTTLDTDNRKSDTKYFNIIKSLNNYVTGFLPTYQEWEDKEAEQKYNTNFEKKFSVKIDKDISNTPEMYKSIIKMPEPYLDAVKNIGSVSSMPGHINGNIFAIDEICRTQNHFIKYKGAYYPSIAMKAFLIISNPQKIILNKQNIEFPDLNYKIKHKCALFQTVVPVRYYNVYKSGYSHINYSAIDIVESVHQLKNGQSPKLNPELFKNKVVVLGANVPAGTGLNDNKNTPVRISHPGVDIQATAIDNLIHNEFLKVAPDSVNYLITILGMLLIYFAIKKLNITKAILTILFLIIGYIAIGAICFYFYIIINILTPIVIYVLTTIFAYTHKYVLENRSKEKVKSAMSKYMSKDVMQNVVKNIDNLGLGGKKAVVTVLFADIRGFTSMSEKMSAQQVSEFLNEYFSEMEPIITNYNGIINKFIGDAIMAVFGEPIQNDKHAQNAVKCAYEMLKRVEKLGKKWAREGKPEIQIGIGINTGEVFIGNIGSVNRMEYTVIGDTVNLASRLENYNKVYKTKMLISASTYKAVRSFADVVKIPDVQIRGKSNKMDIYEVLKVKEVK